MDTGVLNIVTASRVVRWSPDGMADLFVSNNKGIVAAKETRDGSQLLAIADGRIVFIHDIQECLIRRRHTLSENSGRVQLLAFPPNSQELYFTTTIQQAIRRYEVRKNVLRKPTYTVPRVAVLLTVSSAYVLTACNDPGTVFLRKLGSISEPITIDVLPSPARIRLGAFHPEYFDTFCLGFDDGTVAVYRVSQSQDGKVHHPRSPLAVYKFDHVLGGTMTMTALEFLPSLLLTTISINNEKTCQVVSFRDGKGYEVRQWKFHTPPTCMAVLHDVRKSLIAIGTQDGVVFIYDRDGELLNKIVVNSDRIKIIDIDWVSTGVKSTHSGPRQATAVHPSAHESDHTGESSQTMIVCQPSRADPISDMCSLGPSKGNGIGAQSKPTRPGPTQHDEIAEAVKQASVTSHSHQSPPTKYTWKPPILTTSQTSPMNTFRPAADGAQDSKNGSTKPSPSFEDSTSSQSSKLFQRFRSPKSARRESVSLSSPTSPTKADYDLHLMKSRRSSEIVLARMPRLSTNADNVDGPTPFPRRDRATIAQQRRLTPSMDFPKLQSVPKEGPEQGESDTTPINTAEMNQTFAGFSSRGTIANRSDDTSTPMVPPSLYSELKELRHAVDEMKQEIIGLTQCIRSTSSVPKSAEKPEIQANENTKGTKNSPRHAFDDCCAANILYTLLKQVNCGHKSNTRAFRIHHPISYRRSALERAQKFPIRRACPHPGCKGVVHSLNDRCSRPQRKCHHSATSIDTGLNTRHAPRHAYRRQHHSCSRPGWIRIGKFQVRRMSAESNVREGPRTKKNAVVCDHVSLGSSTPNGQGTPFSQSGEECCGIGFD